MFRRFTTISLLAFAATLLAAGCNLIGPNRNYDSELAHYKQVAKTVEHPELTTPPSENAFTPSRARSTIMRRPDNTSGGICR